MNDQFSMHNPSIEHKDKLPRISVGIVVLDCVEQIRTALDSVVNQPYKNIELIVVDGGSSDGTLSVLDEYSKHISITVSEKDKGIYDAMNKVCALATGDWLIFLGCDDVLLDVIGDIAEVLNQSGAVYYGDAILRSHGSVYGGNFSKLRLIQKNICHQSMFYPKAVYKKYSYRLDYRWLADYHYNIRLVGDGVPLIYTGVVVSIFNDKGASSLGDAEFERDKFRIIWASFGIAYALAYALIKLLRKLIPAAFLNKLRRRRRRTPL